MREEPAVQCVFAASGPTLQALLEEEFRAYLRSVRDGGVSPQSK